MSDYAPPSGPPPGSGPSPSSPQGIVPPSGPPPGALAGQPGMPAGYGQPPIQDLAGRGRTPSYSSPLVDEANRKWGAPPVRRKPVGAPSSPPQQQQQQPYQQTYQQAYQQPYQAQQPYQQRARPGPAIRTSTSSTSSSLRGMMNTLKSKAQVEARALANTVKQYESKHGFGGQQQQQAYASPSHPGAFTSPDGYQYGSTAQASPLVEPQGPSQQSYQSQYQYPGAVSSPISAQSPVAAQPVAQASPMQGAYGYQDPTQTTYGHQDPSQTAYGHQDPSQTAYGYQNPPQSLPSHPDAPSGNPPGFPGPSIAELHTQPATVMSPAQPVTQPVTQPLAQHYHPGSYTVQGEYPAPSPSTTAYPQLGPGSGAPTEAATMPPLDPPGPPGVSSHNGPLAQTQVGSQTQVDSQTQVGASYPGVGAPTDVQQPAVLATDHGYPGSGAAPQSPPEAGYIYPAGGQQTAPQLFGQDQPTQQPLPITSLDNGQVAADGLHEPGRLAETGPAVTVASTTPVLAPKPNSKIHAALLEDSVIEGPASPPTLSSQGNPGMMTEVPVMTSTGGPDLSYGYAAMPDIGPPPSHPSQAAPGTGDQTPAYLQSHVYPATAGPEPLDFHAPVTMPHSVPPAGPQLDPVPSQSAPLPQPRNTEMAQANGLPSAPPESQNLTNADYSAPSMPPPGVGVVPPKPSAPFQSPPPGTDTVALIANGMADLTVYSSGTDVRDVTNGSKDAWVEDVPRRVPLRMSPDGTPNEVVWDCPGNSHDNGYVATWHRLPGAPDFLICTRCFARYLAGTSLAPSFDKIKRHGARCRFNVPRIRSVLLPECVKSGSVSSLEAFMAARTGIKDCTLKRGFKGTDGVQLYEVSRETNDVMVNFVACRACYEDVILASAAYGPEFVTREAKQRQPQPADAQWTCDMSFGYVRRSFSLYSRNGAPFDDWVAKATGFFQLPVCDTKGGVEASSRAWVRPRDPVEGMVICERCYFDELGWTALEGAFEYIPVAKPVMNTERMDYIFGHRDTPASSWVCDARTTQIENAMAGALLRQDASVFSRAARTIMSSPACKPEGIANGTWYTPRNGPAHYRMCAACFAGFCDAFLEVAHLFEQSPSPSPSGDDDNSPVVCSMNKASPRQYQFLFAMYQAAQEGVWAVALDTMARFIDVPECPRNAQVAGRRWYGWGDCPICEDCYQGWAQEAARGLTLELTGEVADGERMCCMYSPRMREKLASAVKERDTAPLLEYARQRAVVWAQTVPQIKMLRQMQEMQMMSAMAAGMAGVLYQGAAGIQSVAGTTDGHLHGSAALGWHDTENGAMAASKMAEMRGGMAGGMGGWGQILMLQGQWEQWE